jgi:hypothetical protein
MVAGFATAIRNESVLAPSANDSRRTYVDGSLREKRVRPLPANALEALLRRTIRRPLQARLTQVKGCGNLPQLFRPDRGKVDT